MFDKDLLCEWFNAALDRVGVEQSPDKDWYIKVHSDGRLEISNYGTIDFTQKRELKQTISDMKSETLKFLKCRIIKLIPDVEKKCHDLKVRAVFHGDSVDVSFIDSEGYDYHTEDWDIYCGGGKGVQGMCEVIKFYEKLISTPCVEFEPFDISAKA